MRSVNFLLNSPARAEQELLKEVRVSPTLVKYADPNSYEMETRRELRQIASELMKDVAIEPARPVDLLDDEPLEIELASHASYTNTAIIPTARSGRKLKPSASPGVAKLSKPDCAIADGMTRCCAPSAPASSSASTS